MKHHLIRLPRRSLLLLTCLFALAGCTRGDDASPKQAFESDLPGASDDSKGQNAGADPTSAEGDSSNDDAARAIEEADMIQVVGDRLYALSRHTGLSIVDISDPANLRLSGRYRELRATPFEMYVRDSVAIVMLSDWGQYVEADDGYRWVQTSKVVALDVSKPSAIALLGTFDVAGSISDSRIVGDVMYVVGYQDGYCWGCAEQQPRTAIISLDVKNPRAMRKVDELTFEDDDNQWGWNRRSVTVTSERMYVAGPEYGNNGPVGSTIQVVDISDPNGELVEGASVQAEGQVSSRWQMDEHEGVLRVLSQSPAWRSDMAPVLQTYRVASSSSVEPLGRTELVLPRAEQLQSVRFDGTRAYAVTFERTDPLFTLDLSDPAAPKQMGELEMPGFLYYMQPRGNRMLGLGFDQGNPDGGITVSLFDVEDLSAPKMLQRVNFGGEFGSLPEDQDRIHKAFRVLDEEGLVLVPFSGWDNDGDCWGGYRSGVQLVDFVGDTLTLRGAVPSRGEARRAFLHEGALFTVSDERVESYGVTDRDAPKRLGQLALARNVSHTAPLANGTVARLSNDWWSDQILLDVVDADDVELAHASEGELVIDRSLSKSSSCDGYTWISSVLAHGNQIELIYRRETWNSQDYQTFSGVLVVDAQDPSKLAVGASIEWKADDNWWWYDDFYSYGSDLGQSAFARTDDALVMLESGYDYRSNNEAQRKVRLRVVDMSGPKDLSVATLELPSEQRFAGLIAERDTVLTSHYEPSGTAGRVRFFVDRFDVSDPKAPGRGPSINVPGTLVHHDVASNRILTSELVRKDAGELTWEACYERFAFAEFEWDEDERGSCVGYVQQINLVHLGESGAELEDTFHLAEDRGVSTASAGDGRMFLSLGSGDSYGYGVAIDCFGPCGQPTTSVPSQVVVLSGYGAGKLTVGTLDVTDERAPWWWWASLPVHAQGKRALLIGSEDLVLIDASDAAKPRVLTTQPMTGWVQSVSMMQDTALLSLGMGGVERFDMSR